MITGELKSKFDRIPTPALLARVVDLLDDIPMDKRDTNGDFIRR